MISYRAVLILFSSLLTGCMGLFYYPTQNLYYEPKKYFDLQPEDVWLELGPKDSHKTKIHGWLFKSKIQPAKGTFLHFHGNAENLTSHYAMMVWVVRAGYNLFIFDYPEYGQSTGHLNPKSVYQTSQAIIEWAQRNSDLSPFIIYGHSLGGNVALKVASDGLDPKLFKAVIIDSSFDSYQKIARDKMSQMWITWPLQPLSYVLFTDRYAPAFDQLPEIPYLVIHGQRDFVVPSYFSNRILDKIKQPKEFWAVEKGFHGGNFVVEDGIYQKRLIDFLEKLPQSNK
jgi:pimeloyl-ACP methyl ester carboxylesterase